MAAKPKAKNTMSTFMPSRPIAGVDVPYSNSSPQIYASPATANNQFNWTIGIDGKPVGFNNSTPEWSNPTWGVNQSNLDPSSPVNLSVWGNTSDTPISGLSTDNPINIPTGIGYEGMGLSGHQMYSDMLPDSPELDTSSSGWGEFGKSLADTKGLGGMSLGVGKLALDGWNTWMGQKNQDFLQKYYGKQQKLAEADFANNANMTNLKLEDRKASALRNQGINPNSSTGQKSVADYMNKWAVKTTV